MFHAKDKAPQQEMWVAANELARPAQSTFYFKVDQTLDSFDFANKVRQACAPAYDQSGTGRPGIDPVVYLKMMMVGFFENLPSERAIASRCADSICIREFLHYDLTEETPDHSSLSVIRQRLEGPIFDQIFTIMLGALEKHGLLRGKNLGIDSSVIEANASLRGLVNRNTGQQYWEYVKGLAQESGIDPKDTEAVRKFDRKRPKKMSNREWKNPDDPDAKIGPKKDGATDMIHKPETVVDLDTGAITSAQVLPGDQADCHDASARILEAQQIINEARGDALDLLTVETATADKGYFEPQEIKALQAQGIKTVICDPVGNRRLDRLEPGDLAAVRAARRSAKSKYGKALLKRRGMHLERGFAHILDCGGMRRATLRGRINLNKRFKLSAAFYNLSQLMRKLFGIGTPGQWAAGKLGVLGSVFAVFVLIWSVINQVVEAARNWFRKLLAAVGREIAFGSHATQTLIRKYPISTGC